MAGTWTRWLNTDNGAWLRGGLGGHEQVAGVVGAIVAQLLHVSQLLGVYLRSERRAHPNSLR